MSNDLPDGEAFLSDYMRDVWGATEELVNNPEYREMVMRTFGFQLAWLPLAAGELGRAVAADVKVLADKVADKVAEKRDEALRRYWRS